MHALHRHVLAAILVLPAIAQAEGDHGGAKADSRIATTDPIASGSHGGHGNEGAAAAPSAAPGAPDTGSKKDNHSNDATMLGIGPMRASAAGGQDTFPISTTLVTEYRFNHSNFVGTEGDVNLGYQLLRLMPSISYSVNEKISLTLSANIDKELSNSLERAVVAGAVGSTTTRSVAMSDITLTTMWGGLAKLPGGISLTGALDVTAPTSAASQASGMVVSMSPYFILSKRLGPVSLMGLGYYTYNINKNPTLQIDCTRFSNLCNVAGPDVGSPSTLHQLTALFAVNYRPISKLRVGTNYLLFNAYGAVKFPDDDQTAAQAQTGTQSGLGFHRLRFEAAWTLLPSTTLVGRMTTLRSLYTNDNKSITIPYFDTDGNTASRTQYSLLIMHSL